MSSKMTRKTTTTASATSSVYSTPQEQYSSGSSQRSRSPLSPTRYSRLAEKAELVNLNDRLAVYMDTVRSLEKENSRLVKQVEISQETITKEKTAYKMMYESELSDARRMLDEIAGERARLEIENKRLKEENEDLKSSLDKSNKETRKLEGSLNLLEHRLAELQAKYNKLVADHKRQEDDLKELDKVKKALETQKKFVENETLARVELENKLQSLKEEANFNEQIYNQEVTTLRSKRREEISEIDGRLTVEYEDKLQAALKELREQYELQLLSNREEIIQLYEIKIRNLTDYNTKHSSATSAAVEELRALQTRYDSASSQLAALESTNANLTARVRELERQLELERTRNVERLASVEQELSRTRDDMTSQLRDYQDLMDIKVALAAEISAYRKLLECEEDRLKITPANVNTPPTRRGTPQRRGTPLAAKRRRVLLDESESADHYEVTGLAHGDVEISDVDPEGNFIELFNKGDKELSLGGWSVKHTVDGKETSFKLHRSVKIEAQGRVTVWSADAGRQHEPPHHIVMKQKWFSGDPSATILVNTDGEEVASRNRQRVKTSSYRHEFDDETDGANPPKECSIM